MQRLGKAERAELEKLLGEAWANIQQAEAMLAAKGAQSENLRASKERLYAEAERLLHLRDARVTIDLGANAA
jgi:hypothetical protein